MSYLRADGLEDLIRELTEAPREIREEAFGILKEETEGAAIEIVQAYAQHSKSGNLAKRVKTEYPSTTLILGIVRSSAPHSHLFEFGTKQRFTKHYGGKRQTVNRGAMPVDKVTPPIAQRHRDRMVRRWIEMLRRRGFQIDG